MVTPSQVWEASDSELIFAMQEIKKELNLRAMCQAKDLPYPPTEEYGPAQEEYIPPFADLEAEAELMRELVYDTPMAQAYGG